MKAPIQVSPRAENPQVAEVRCAVRFPLALPIRVITDTGVYDATTENISASGVLFRSDMNLGVDRRVEFLLTMPAEVTGTDSDVTLHCFGRVVRSYRGSEPGSEPRSEDGSEDGAGQESDPASGRGSEQFHAAAIIDDYMFSDGD
jgi:hypothetical protein